MAMKIIEYQNTYENEVMQLFYKSVFYNRKEFEYARLPTWSHRYNVEGKTIRRLAVDNGKVIGSLGLLPYEGFINKKKYNLGFFVDNCIHPDYSQDTNDILFDLFQDVEHAAKKEKIQGILGWDYTQKTDTQKNIFDKLNYLRVNGINWIGGGTKHIHAFFKSNEKLGIHWRIGFSLLNIKFYFKDMLLKTPKNLFLRSIKQDDLKDVVDLLNSHNKNLLFYPTYTKSSLSEKIKKYCAEAIVAEFNGKIVGVIIYFKAPWSGWMYGKPFYTKSSTMFLIRHPLEFVVQQEFTEQIAPHLILQAMKNEYTNEKYLMLVDVFDSRIKWMKDAYYKIGATELPYDYGTLLYKMLDGTDLSSDSLFYIPTNLVISPYTTKEY